jgi:hypothetical protein
MKYTHILFIGALTLTLAGCGSSGDGGGGAATPQGDSFVGFTQQLSNSAPEDSEANDIDSVQITTPEDTEAENVG